ncbi:MAG: efflux RND transporter permease subunit [Planctomycetes bacterium]|nr:efflux RND transporter permease subunit [Planctomycetota bacterium]
MRIVEHARAHGRALFVLLGLLLAAGVHATWNSARSVYPQISLARIAVIAQRGESPVRGVLAAVTRPIEQAISTVPDLVRVRSKTVRGAAELNLDFRSGANMSEALALVRSRVAQAGLPSDVSVEVERQAPSLFPVLSFNLVPGAAQKDDALARARLTDWAELELRPRIARLPDCFFVTLQSADRREYVFEADPRRLAQAGVALPALEQAIAASDVVQAVGRSASEGLQFQLLVDGRLRTSDELLALAVPRANGAPVRLSELGEVVESTQEQTLVVTAGGEPGIVVSVFLRDGGRVTDLSRDVNAILDEMRPHLPGGARFEPVYDQSRLVDESVQGVRDAIALGALLSILVIFAFLGEWRITLVAGLSIPISVLLTLAAFPLLGESLNLMSLGGLAVAIGLVIDDAIVVGENIARKLAALGGALRGRAARDAIADGTSEVLGAIVGSSLTTVVVFVPLVLLEGVVGQFFRSLAVALGLSILASMLVSLVYAPLCLLLPVLTPRSSGERRWSAALRRGYARAARAVVEHPLPAVVVLVALLVAGIAGLGGLRTGFLPEMDEGGFVLDYSLPVGSSLAQTDAACRRIEHVLLETPEVAALSRRTGAELGFFATEQFTGDMLVGLVPRAKRTRSIFEVLDGLRERLAREVPQAEVEFVQVMQDTINDMAGNPDPIEVKLFGADYPTLQRAADEVERELDHTPGIVDVKNHVSFGSPEISWRIDPARAAALGFTTEQVADQLSMQLLGKVATRIQEGERYVDVRVRYPDEWRVPRIDPEGGSVPLFLGPVALAQGSPMVPIGEVAHFVRETNENELERENQNPMVRVTAAVAGIDLGSASHAVDAHLAKLALDPSVRVVQGGQAQSSKAAFANMLTVFGIAAGLVFLLLVLQFRSISLPLVIFLALPFGMLGGLYALRLGGVALNVSSGMGLIMLVGLVVKNGIIMIEFAQELARTGLSEREAILEAASVRLRPILMTTVAAIAGLLPLAIGIGAGSELQKPLAIAVIGGLVLSTLSTLFIVPLGCAWIVPSRPAREPHDAS